jgi:hypothetical protein
MHRLSGNLITYVLGLAILIAFFLPLPAFSEALSIEYALGFNGYFQLKTWTPLTVVLENRGRATSGTLEVIVTSGSEYFGNVHQTTYAMDVELPYSSTKLCSFTILLESFTHELIIRLRQAEETILSRSFSLRPHYTTKSLAVVLDDKISLDISSVLPQSLTSVSVRHTRFLPETWYGYDGVKLLITNAEMLKSLRDRQFQALTEWIKQGGYLVMTSGINYGALLEQRTQRLLPVHIVGHQQFLELPSLEQFCGQTISNPDPFLVLHVNIDESNALIQEHDIPIIIEKPIGTGKILFLPFDIQNPPFSRLTNRQIFWDKVLSLQPVIDNTAMDVDNQKILDAMLINILAGFPNIKVILLFLGAYILPLRVFLKKLEKRGEKKWKNCGYLLIVIALFSIVSYGFFFYQTERKSLTYTSFALMNIAGQRQIASGQYLIGLYSMKDTAYDFSFGSGTYPVTYLLPEKMEKNIPNRYVLHENPSEQRVTGFAEKWSYAFFTLNTTLEFPVVGQAELDDQRLRIMIENMTSYTISDCQVYFDDRVFFVGDIVPGKEQTKSITRSEMRDKELFDEQQAERIAKNIDENSPSAFVTTLQKNLGKDVLLATHLRYQSRRDSLYFIGWIQSGIIQVSFTKPGIIGQDLTLITWEIPINVT